MKEIFLKLRVEVDPGADPEPSTDDVIKSVKELLTIGMEGIGSVPFGVRDVTLLDGQQSSK
jgi:hypothetical protein